MKRHRFAVLAVTAVVLMVAPPAWPSFPGENGRIFFQSNRSGPPEIYSMNPDGSDVRRLTWNDVPDQMPRVSADGTRVVFARTVAGNDLDIWIMNADGSDAHAITTTGDVLGKPRWSADGTRLAYDQRLFEGSTIAPTQNVAVVDAAGGAAPVVIAKDARLYGFFRRAA